MAKKHLILVHGRDIKPAERAMFDLAQKAIASGLRRAKQADALRTFESGNLKISLAYYGDINNAILSEKSDSEKKKLKARDPEHGNAPCFPAEMLVEAFEFTDAGSKLFDAAAYKKILAANKDWRFLDEAADAVSLFGALLTGGLLNTLSINIATSDLGAYLTSHSVGSAVRERLNGTLRKALEEDDDICLLTHSMGCMVAYDVLWKYAHISEYGGLRSKQRRVGLWLTIGNPLGETGVRRNLLDGRYSAEDQYPRGQISDWSNFYAVDDFVSHIERIAPIYRPMRDARHLPSISDAKVYNCWIYKDMNSGEFVSNPHDFYGYLMNQRIAGRLAKWLAG